MSPPRPPPHPGAVLAQAMIAIGHARAVPIFARLGLGRHLASGPKTAPELAEATGLRPDAFARFLLLCAAVGLVYESEERYSLTEMGAMLDEWSHEATLRGEHAYVDAWSDLEASLRAETGPRTIDLAALKRARVAGSHHAALAEYAAGFGRSGTYVDLGSGDASLLEAVLKASPRSEAIYVGRDHEAVKAQLRAAKLAHRATFAEPAPEVPKGDAVILSNRLEECSDDQALALLGRCRFAAKRVLVIGPARRNQLAQVYALSAVIDLELLLFTHHGRVRSDDELNALCMRAGLEVTRIVPAQGYFVLEAAYTGPPT